VAWQEEYLDMIEDCEKRQSKLSEWEEGFIQSLREWIEAGKVPTPKQTEKLDNIWDRVTK
jgi:hypothetical protein